MLCCGSSFFLVYLKLILEISLCHCFTVYALSHVSLGRTQMSFDLDHKVRTEAEIDDCMTDTFAYFSASLNI